MVDVEKAKKLIIDNCNSAKVILLPLSDVHGCILAESVIAAFDTPLFHQSAMDGYAFSFDSWNGENELYVAGEIQAGTYSSDLLKPLEAVGIFTGAPLPAGADTVVMKEKVIVNGNTIAINDGQLTKGSNVRLKGSQTKKGEIALNKGQFLIAPAISFLAGIGIDKVRVYEKPLVRIIITGKELIKPGSTITSGKTFESNSFGLVAALNQLSISPVSVEFVDDVEEEIVQAITNSLDADILILTGGISVGDYDFAANALGKCSVEKIFHKVKQKPGKPFYFGRYHQTLVFALPGNPGAVLICFYEYIAPAISCFTRREYLYKCKMPMAEDYKKKSGLTYFLKGKMNFDKVSVLPDQESYLMNSFAISDCLIKLDEEREYYRKGDMVELIKIT